MELINQIMNSTPKDFIKNSNKNKLSINNTGNPKSNMISTFIDNKTPKKTNFSSNKRIRINSKTNSLNISFGERLYMKSIAQSEVKEYNSKKIRENQRIQQYKFKPSLNDSDFSYMKVY